MYDTGSHEVAAPPPPEARLRCDGLTLSYDGLKHAVAALSFAVAPGSIFALVGPNGAGKTSTLRVLATLTRPTDGRIVLDGIDVIAQPARARHRIGYLPDDFALYDTLTPREYLDFFARCHDVPASERTRRIDSLIEELDLGEKRDALIGSLSRGMRQRLGLAKTLIHAPKLVLLDEPASALDPGARLKLRDILIRLKQRGLTIVISSHILPDLAGIADAIGIMEAGRMVACGPLDQVARSVGRAQTRYRIEISSHLDRAQRVIDEFGPRLRSLHCSVLHNGAAAIELELDGDQQRLADLVESLVLRGVRLHHVAPVESTLEAVYRASGAMQVC